MIIDMKNKARKLAKGKNDLFTPVKTRRR